MTIHNHKSQCFHKKLTGNLVDSITGANLYWWKITSITELELIKLSKCLLTCEQTVKMFLEMLSNRILKIDIVEYHNESLSHFYTHNKM